MACCLVGGKAGAAVPWGWPSSQPSTRPCANVTVTNRAIVARRRSEGQRRNRNAASDTAEGTRDTAAGRAARRERDGAAAQGGGTHGVARIGSTAVAGPRWGRDAVRIGRSPARTMVIGCVLVGALTPGAARIGTARLGTVELGVPGASNVSDVSDVSRDGAGTPSRYRRGRW